MKQGNPSRREFLRTASAAAAAGAFPTLLKAAPAEAGTLNATAREGMSWEETSAALRADLRAPREVLIWYTESADGSSACREVRDLGILRGSEKDTERDELLGKKFAGEGARLARKAHVHGFNTLLAGKFITKTDLERIERGELQPPLAAPSFADFESTIWITKRCFTESDTHFEDWAFDPSGTWRMTLHDGPFSQLWFKIQTLQLLTIPEALARSGLPKEKVELLKKALRSTEEHVVRLHGTPEIITLFKEYYGLRDQSDQSFIGPMLVYPTMVADLQRESAFLSPTQRNDRMVQIIEEARKLDITLSFEPYEALHTK